MRLAIPRFGIRARLAPITAVALAVALVSACASTSTSTPSGPVSQDLKVVLSDQPQTLNPVLGARSASLIWSAMVEPFVHTGKDLQPDKTGLATDWTRVDPTTWQFTMREGVKFHNGELADAAAVVFSINQNRDNTKAILKSYFASIAEATAVDAKTVKVVTKSANISVPAMFTTLYVLPPKYYAEKGDTGFDAAPVGTGPYKFESRASGQNVKAVANPDYWQGAPKLKSITWTWSNDASSRAALLQSNGADLVADIPVENQAGPKGTQGVTLTDYATVTKITVFMQSGKAPMNDVNLRKAVALAINRDLIASSIFKSVGAKADAGLLNISPNDKPLSPVAFDATAAKALVTGTPTIDLTYPAGHNPHIQDVAEAIAGMLKTVGITANLIPVDYSTLVKQAVAGSMSGIFLLGAVPVFPHPDVFVHGFITANSITKNCVDPALDALASQGLAAADDAAAKAVYDQIEKSVVSEKYCYVPLYDQTVSWGSRGVTGFDFLPVTLVDWYPVGKS